MAEDYSFLYNGLRWYANSMVGSAPEVATYMQYLAQATGTEIQSGIFSAIQDKHFTFMLNYWAKKPLGFYVDSTTDCVLRVGAMRLYPGFG